VGALVCPGRGRRARAQGRDRPPHPDPAHALALARHPPLRPQAPRTAGGDPLSIRRKYDEVAETFTEREYVDPARYFGRRAEIVATLGPPLVPGDRVLDLAAADASFAPPLLARGLAYTGVDLSEAMVAVARRRHGEAIRVELADMFAYRPPEPVAATVCFRSLYFAHDRPAFLRHIAGFTEKKVLFDLDPRREPLAAVAADLRAAGFDRVATAPFFVPQHAAPPRAVTALLAAAERFPPAAALVLRLRFSLICAGYRAGATA
jgi:SAM-dependent methyltransferase